jgi:oxygen-independent coproporphyrinogen-3 oxidase
LAAGRLPIAEKEVLSREQQMIEMIYLGLRTTAGINLEAFEWKFGVSLLEVCQETIAGLEQEGRIFVRDRHLGLTPKGMRFLDSIAGMFIGQEMSGPSPTPDRLPPDN